MSDDDRPRKLAKLDATDETMDQELGPAMTGAGPANDDSEQQSAQIAGDNAPTTSETTGDSVALPTELAPTEGTEGDSPKISKNQLKKIRRQERWAEMRDVRKVKRKAQAKHKKERRQAMINEARETGGEEAVIAVRKQWEGTKAKLKRSKLLPFTIIIDCGYDELMNTKEHISLSSQLTRAYSDNNRAPWRGNLIYSSFGGHLKERFDTVLTAHKNWKGIKMIPEDFVQAAEVAKTHMASTRGGQLLGPFEKYPEAKPEDGEVIYLSSDSENTLTELKPYCTYIIGGLVDKNRHKAVCYRNAVDKGIKTAKLPLGEYIKMRDRTVLTTNHVVDIMLQWMDTGDWGEAFMKVLPTRKGGQLKEKSEGQDADNDDGAEEEASEDEKEESDVAIMAEIEADAVVEAEEEEHES